MEKGKPSRTRKPTELSSSKDLPQVPARFLRVRYNGPAHPQASVPGLSRGANCQRFVFELLKHFGYESAPMRSSELCKDRTFTQRVLRMRAFDILMFNRDERAWGAHVALYLGNGRAIHLSKAIGRPGIWDVPDFFAFERYRVLVAIKRPIRLTRVTRLSHASRTEQVSNVQGS
jgi:hypothetical protein